MIIAWSTFILSLIFLTVIAKFFIDGTLIIAAHTKISKSMIGLTLVAIGTSVPELFFSIMAGIQYQTEMAVGNVIGSNIANIGLIFSIIVILHPQVINKKIPWMEIIILLIVTIFLAWILWQGELSRLNSFILFLLTFVIFYLFYNKEKKIITNNKMPQSCYKSLKFGIILFIVGAIGLPISSNYLVISAVSIANIYQISEFLVALVVIAIGTSLPELATSIIALIKHEHDLVVANIIGSNIFNSTLVLASAGLIYPDKLKNSSIHLDITLMVILSIIFILLLLKIKFLTSRILAYACFMIYMIYLSYMWSTYIYI